MTTRTYDDIADWYAGWIHRSVEGDVFFPSVASLIGDVSGIHICDLACGEGRVARYLGGHGAHVIGVDISRNLLQMAQAEEDAEPLGVEYRFDDAARLETIPDASLDGVLCHLALMDIEDLEPVIHSVARVLQPQGWFVFSTLHPCFHTPSSSELVKDDGTLYRIVNGYWEEGYWRSDERIGPPGQIGAYHRTLSTYFNTLIDAGLAVERVLEPHADMRVNRPVWTEVPAVITIRCVKSFPFRPS